MTGTTTRTKEKKLSFIMDDEEFLTREGAMMEMQIGATTLANEIRIGNITPYPFSFGYGFSKASAREQDNHHYYKIFTENVKELLEKL